MTRPDRTVAQVKIEPGKKSKPATPTPTPRKPIADRKSLPSIWAKRKARAAPEIEMVLVPGSDSPGNRSDDLGFRLVRKYHYVRKYH